jgi:hypothetical protein
MMLVFAIAAGGALVALSPAGAFVGYHPAFTILA